MKQPWWWHVLGTLIALAIITVTLLVLPWVGTGYRNYLDWQYCQTHDPSDSLYYYRCTPTGEAR